MSNNYYMIITKEDDYVIDIENQFETLGFPEKNGKSVKNFKKGDKIVFYITKKSVFGAIVEVTGEHFYDKTKIWDDEYDLWPNRINCKPIYRLKEYKSMVYIKDIWDNLEFIKNKGKWGVYVQGSLKRLSQNDYEIIEKEISKRFTKK